MKKPISYQFYIALAVVLVAVASLIVWLVTQPPDEPVYQGKKLSEWMMKHYTTGEGGQAIKNGDEAVRQAGTNAIPTLLRMLRAKDSLWKVRLMVLAQRQHIIRVQSMPAIGWNSCGVMGFHVLGMNAQSALPELIEIIHKNISPESQSCAIYSLSWIGPSAKEAIPTLLRCATNSNSNIRTAAINTLFRIDPNAADRAGLIPIPDILD